MLVQPPDTYRFGPFEVRVRARELYKYGTKLKLRPQPFQVLCLLMERPGDVVTREELRRKLWPAETFVDFEHGLNTTVKDLRRTLSDSASDPRYIETLPRLGYRLVVRVEAVQDLRNAGDEKPAGQGMPAPAEGPPRLLPWLRPAGLSVALAMLLACWILIARRPEPEGFIPMPLTSFPGIETEASWSPDGREVAFTRSGEKEGQFDIWVLQPGSSQTLRLTATAGHNGSPAWSPDGRWIAYIHGESRWGNHSLNVVSPLGGPSRTVLTSETAVGSLSWTPDGRALVFDMISGEHQPAALWVVGMDTGFKRALTEPPAGIAGDTGPAVSPDGRTVAFCRATGWRMAELYLMDLGPDLSLRGMPRRMTDLGFVARPAWTPDSSRIVFEAQRDGAGMWQLDRSGRNLRPVFGVPDTASLPAIGKRPGGGTSLIFTNTNSKTTIWRCSTNTGPGGAPVELAPSSRTQRYPRYSADGKRLAFSSNRSGYEEIWVANADGSQPVQLTALRHLLTEAADWSPGGDQIAFVSQDGARRQIYRINALGGPATAITNEGGVSSGDGWSRDGRGYYYTSTRSGRREVWEAPLDGGRQEQMTRNGGRCGFESAQGVFYYWRLDSGKAGNLMRRTPEGERPVSLTPEARACGTAPAAKGFYFKSADTSDIYLYEESTGRCARVLQHPARPFNQFTISPDGHWFATDFIGEESADLMIVERFR